MALDNVSAEAYSAGNFCGPISVLLTNRYTVLARSSRLDNQRASDRLTQMFSLRRKDG